MERRKPGGINGRGLPVETSQVIVPLEVGRGWS